MPGRHEDETLLLADVARKALRQVKATTQGLLAKHMDPERAGELAELLSTGVWTHDHPLMATDLEQLGLPVKVGVPAEERVLMDLYPQAAQPSGLGRIRSEPKSPNAAWSRRKGRASESIAGA